MNEKNTYYSGAYPDESGDIIDYDKVLRDMKFKFGWGDISPNWLDEFEEDMDNVIEVWDTNEYISLFADWMESKSIGDNL